MHYMYVYIAYIQNDAMHTHMHYTTDKEEHADKKELEYSSWNGITTLYCISLKCYSYGTYKLILVKKQHMLSEFHD